MVVKDLEVVLVYLNEVFLLLRGQEVKVSLHHGTGLGWHHLGEVEGGWGAYLVQDVFRIISQCLVLPNIVIPAKRKCSVVLAWKSFNGFHHI